MNLVVISDNKAYRYVNGKDNGLAGGAAFKLDQICEIQATRTLKNDIEFFRVNGLDIE